MLSIDGRRKLQSTLSSATALGFDGESFLVSLANITSVPLELITLDVGQTYRSNSTVLAFRVDSRFTLPMDDQRLPDAYAVAGLLSSLTLEQLADLHTKALCKVKLGAILDKLRLVDGTPEWGRR